jgi:hypothetical protein
MQKREVIDNDHVLWRELRTYVAPMPALDLFKPHYLALTSASYSVILHQDYLEVTGKKKGPAHVSSSSIIRFDHESSKDNRQYSGVTCHTLHFSEKVAFGRKLILCGNAEMVVYPVRIPAADRAQNHAVGITRLSGHERARWIRKKAPLAEARGASRT